MVLAGPTEFFSSRNDLLRILPARCALVLAPKSQHGRIPIRRAAA